MTMPELFHLSAAESAPPLTSRRRRQLHRSSVTLTRSSEHDEFVRGYRDCANESLRYLDAAIATAPSDEQDAEAESSGRVVVDALRVHLLQHEADAARRRRRRSSAYVHLDVSSDAASLERANHHLRSPHHTPARRQRRRRPTRLSTHRLGLRHHHPMLHVASEEEVQTVISRRETSVSDSNPAVASICYSHPGDDSGYDGNLATDTASDRVVRVESPSAGDVDDVRFYASQLSTLAERDSRVCQLLTELFHLMDSDSDLEQIDTDGIQ